MVADALSPDFVPRRQYDELRTQLVQANARIAELTVEVGRLADLVARGNDRITELLAIAQRKKGTARGASTDRAPEPPPSLDEAAKAGE